MSPSPLIAVLDIGTNTIILLIAERRGDGGYRVLHDEARVVRLGEGIHAHSCFLPHAMDRAYAALSDFKNTIDASRCMVVKAVGTAAFRNADNAEDFIRRVRDGLGIAIEVIDGSREAELIFSAARVDFNALPRPLMVLDIGGGSTEFIFDDGKSPVRAISLPFGSVKLTENFLASDPPTFQELATLDTFLDRQLTTLPDLLGPLALIATAGTATTLAALTQKLSIYDEAKVHGSVIPLNQLKTLTQYLASMPFAKRKNLPCLEPRRADVIVGGARILIKVCERYGVDAVRVSDRGLRFGVFFDEMAARKFGNCRI